MRFVCTIFGLMVVVMSSTFPLLAIVAGATIEGVAVSSILLIFSIPFTIIGYKFDKLQEKKR